MEEKQVDPRTENDINSVVPYQRFARNLRSNDTRTAQNRCGLLQQRAEHLASTALTTCPAAGAHLFALLPPHQGSFDDAAMSLEAMVKTCAAGPAPTP